MEVTLTIKYIEVGIDHMMTLVATVSVNVHGRQIARQINGPKPNRVTVGSGHIRKRHVNALFSTHGLKDHRCGRRERLRA